MILEKFNPLLIIIPPVYVYKFPEGKMFKTKLLTQSKAKDFFSNNAQVEAQTT